MQVNQLQLNGVNQSMTEQKFDISGMTCAACSAGIQKTVCKMNGVRVAEVSLMGESMRAEFDENAVSSEDIVRAVEALGYGARIAADIMTHVQAQTSKAAEKAEKKQERKEKKEERLAKDAVMGEEAVSYTHLDVYKRQRYNRHKRQRISLGPQQQDTGS